jgi:hypothetical protein
VYSTIGAGSRSGLIASLVINLFRFQGFFDGAIIRGAARGRLLATAEVGAERLGESLLPGFR